MVIQTPAGPRRVPHIISKQTPVRHTVSNKPNLGPAQLASRKLIQKSVKILNTPKLKTPEKIPLQTPKPVAPFPLTDQSLNTETSPIEIPLTKPPGLPAAKLPPQQALMPQNNPFDINSELIPFQEQEVEAVFTTPELDDFSTREGEMPVPVCKKRVAPALVPALASLVMIAVESLNSFLQKK